ncbi:recombinase family protein [Fibrella sp. HMF5405]|uniref:Recombinase family protein n=1 Tax=Fibrella forsythiae TaxID=2817061 RepID=A0ABS3JVJ0_9BACT|nr:recombinase family protein [Fibrella forsythiae]
MASKVNFRAVDDLHLTKMMVKMLTVLSEHEREQISTRTIEALTAANVRGKASGKHGLDCKG